jgi:hypothetical protein
MPRQKKGTLPTLLEQQSRTIEAMQAHNKAVLERPQGLLLLLLDKSYRSKFEQEN